MLEPQQWNASRLTIGAIVSLPIQDRSWVLNGTTCIHSLLMIILPKEQWHKGRALLSAFLWPGAMETGPIIHTRLYRAVRLSIEALVHTRTNIEKVGRIHSCTYSHRQKNHHNTERHMRRVTRIERCNEWTKNNEWKSIELSNKQKRWHWKFWNRSTDIF